MAEDDKDSAAGVVGLQQALFEQLSSAVNCENCTHVRLGKRIGLAGGGFCVCDHKSPAVLVPFVVAESPAQDSPAKDVLGGSLAQVLEAGQRARNFAKEWTRQCVTHCKFLTAQGSRITVKKHLVSGMKRRNHGAFVNSAFNAANFSKKDKDDLDRGTGGGAGLIGV